MNRSVGLLLLLARPTLAWDTGPPDTEGPAAARVVWDDEHPDLYRRLLAERGFTDPRGPITVFTDGTTTADGDDTVAPAIDWAGVAAAEDRAFETAMFSGLPDMSWSLAAWLGGNEICPLGSDYTGGCFAFTGWLGGLNSTHFPPQAAHSHAFYHGLALATADRCAATSTDLDGLGYPEGTGYRRVVDDIVEQCELEALAFEGIAQHYLQDAWSSGHMWQRWGSPTPTDWSNRAHALAVGTVAGLIHGHEPITGVADPLCAPHPDVAYIPGGGGGPTACVGDLYLADLLDGPSYTTQHAEAWACTGGSLDEVAAALPGALGGRALGHPAPTDAACFDQRVTNLAFYTGLFATWRFSADVVANTIRTVSRLSFLAIRLPPPLRGLLLAYEVAFRRDATAIAILLDASRWSANNPLQATNFAQGVVYDDTGAARDLTMLGMGPNGDYAAQIDVTEGLVSFDPPARTLNDGEGGTSQQRADADLIRHGLHRAHADWWCDALSVEAEGSDLSALSERCKEDPVGNAAVCGLCGELALRHHRIGTGPDDYDTEQEPVCHALASTPEYIYVPTDDHVDQADPRAAAVFDWCRADCAVRFVVTDVVTGASSATDDVDSDVVLTEYLELIEAFLIYFDAQSSYWLSQGQFSLSEYYGVLRDNMSRELVAMATFTAAIGRADEAVARFDGGPVEDDYFGVLDGMIGYATAGWVDPATVSWGDITSSPHRLLAAPTINDTVPFLIMFGLKTAHLHGETGVAFEAQDFLWIDGYFGAYTPDPVVTLSLDGLPWVAGTSSGIAAQTASARFEVGEAHELAVQLSATVYDGARFPALEQTAPLDTTLFTIRFTVEEGGEDAACP